MPVQSSASSAKKIRTKTNLLPEQIDNEYFSIVEALGEGKLSISAYLHRCMEYFYDRISEGFPSEFVDLANKTPGGLELLRRHIDERRYTVVLYRVDEDEVHAPHHHYNVASTQILLEGKLRLREFDRVARNETGQLILELRSDKILKPGDCFQASEWNRNVHWFQAIDGPALIFNTNVRGFEASTFDISEDSFGRRYIDPSRYQEDGSILGRELDKEEATKLFAGKSLDDFPVPNFVSEKLNASN